jgi:manganese transport protein
MGATDVLVLSQVFLSFGIPFALFPLIRLTSDAKLMGNLVNGLVTRIVGYTVALALTVLNLWTLVQLWS